MTDPRTIPESEINQAVAEALDYKCSYISGVWYWCKGESRIYTVNHRYREFEKLDPLYNPTQLMQLWFDNWDDVCNVLANWLYGWEDRRGKEPDGEIEEYSWWDNPEFKENKPLWILRALVASR